MLTKLQAINDILTSVGETAALTLVAGAADTTNAEAVLDSETLKVLAKGWEFNTDDEVTLAPDVNGRVAVPADALFIDPLDPSEKLAERGGFLYDKAAGTDVLGRSVKVKVVRAIPFESCPYHVQRLIVAQATVKYQRSYVGSAVLDKTAQDELASALVQSEDLESDSEDLNVLDNPHVFGRLRRRNPYWNL